MRQEDDKEKTQGKDTRRGKRTGEKEQKQGEEGGGLVFICPFVSLYIFFSCTSRYWLDVGHLTEFRCTTTMTIKNLFIRLFIFIMMFFGRRNNALKFELGSFLKLCICSYFVKLSPLKVQNHLLAVHTHTHTHIYMYVCVYVCVCIYIYIYLSPDYFDPEENLKRYVIFSVSFLSRVTDTVMTEKESERDSKWF